jgi:acyl-CoA reductase-like NAD-dependent aldehyde dehydrogenase
MARGGLENGFFIEPTIFTGVTDEMTIAREEIFGPVLSAFAFDSEEEVLKRANATPFGLGSGVWTRDLGTAHRMARGIQSGSVWVNCYQMLDPGVPFGGYKLSGFGRDPVRITLRIIWKPRRSGSIWTDLTPSPCCVARAGVRLCASPPRPAPDHRETGAGWRWGASCAGS